MTLPPPIEALTATARIATKVWSGSSMIGESALDLAEAVQQPPALDLEHLGD
jgi:hypothetical protein